MQLNRWPDVIRMRIRSLFQRRRVEDELARELRFHLESAETEAKERGLTREDAALAARRRLGATLPIAEQCRDIRPWQWCEQTWKDLVYAARSLARTPGLLVVLILTIALAIGANSAIFSVVESVLFRPLPYPQPERLVRFFLNNHDYPKFPLNPYDFRDYRERARSFTGMAAYAHDDLQLAGSGKAERMTAFAVTAGFFDVLGARPEFGREFTRSDEFEGAELVALVSRHLWQTRFAGAATIVGRKLILNGESYRVAGVMPDIAHPGNDYHAVVYGQTVDVWVPFRFHDPKAERGPHYLDGVARLKPGISVAAAAGELNSIMRQLAREHEADRNWQVTVTPLASEIVGKSARLLWVLVGSVAFVLLIACVNAANLLLARASVRERELALRAALGAQPQRLVRLLLAESLFLSVTGALVGALLAVAGVHAFTALLPADFPRASDIHVNAGLFLCASAVALLCALLAGLGPAWQASRTDLRDSLHEANRSLTAGVRSAALRNSLIACEVALASVLVVSAGLLLRSFVNLLASEPGFDGHGVTTATLSLRTPSYDYRREETFVVFYKQLLANLAAHGGIAFAGAATDLPWTGYNENAGFALEGKTPQPGEEFHARYHAASPDYFRALSIPLIAGRFFDEHDRVHGPKTVLINQAFARRYFPNANPLGKRLAISDKPSAEDWLTVVGIVGDVKDSPAADNAEPAYWWPLLAAPFADISLAVKTKDGHLISPETISAAVRALDPTLAVADIAPMNRLSAHLYAPARFALFLLSLFALLALTLAAIGIYGVVSYSMNRRSREFGLRIALGAQRSDVMRAIFRSGLQPVFLGLLLGLLASLLAGPLLASLLYRVTAHDSIAFVTASVTSIGAGVLACLLPALRAARRDPMSSLRAD